MASGHPSLIRPTLLRLGSVDDRGVMARLDELGLILHCSIAPPSDIGTVAPPRPGRLLPVPEPDRRPASTAR